MVEFSRGMLVSLRGTVFGRQPTPQGELIGVDVGGARNLWLPAALLEIARVQAGDFVTDREGRLLFVQSVSLDGLSACVNGEASDDLVPLDQLTLL